MGYTIVGKEGLKIGTTCKTEDGERVLGIQKQPAIMNIWGKNALSNTEVGERRDRIKKLMHPTLAPKALQAYLAGMKKDVDKWMSTHLEHQPENGVLRAYQVRAHRPFSSTSLHLSASLSLPPIPSSTVRARSTFSKGAVTQWKLCLQGKYVDAIATACSCSNLSRQTFMFTTLTALPVFGTARSRVDNGRASPHGPGTRRGS